ncbi:MAG: phosphatidate cytidylyltransferase [Arachidicoccus sp.]|nr:phosphatidate cytidylyltransferase [Arachidicoccus sp.]
MALNKQTFQVRTLTAIIFVVIMLCGLLINQWTFFLLFFIIHWGCWKEFIKLYEKINVRYADVASKSKEAPMLIGCGFLIFCLPHYFKINQYVKVYYIGIFIFLAGLLYFLFRLLKEDQSRRGVLLKYSFLGLIYISLTWGAMINLSNLNLVQMPLNNQDSLPLRILNTDIYDLGYIAALTLIGSIWINDTMQYIVGSLIGKTPFSQISPNKTLEGTLGGSLLCVVIIGLIGYIYKHEFVSLFVYIALVAAIVGTCGDLLESKIKRMAGVKDSGNLMPGHGGFLDRFDSLILSVPFVWIAIEAIVYIITNKQFGG